MLSTVIGVRQHRGNQGCQIFLGTTYQKFTKIRQNVPVAVKYIKEQ
jgi:hypothetical protein